MMTAEVGRSNPSKHSEDQRRGKPSHTCTAGAGSRRSSSRRYAGDGRLVRQIINNRNHGDSKNSNDIKKEGEDESVRRNQHRETVPCTSAKHSFKSFLQVPSSRLTRTGPRHDGPTLGHRPRLSTPVPSPPAGGPARPSGRPASSSSGWTS